MTEIVQAWERTLRHQGSRRAMVEAQGARTITFGELDAAALAWGRKQLPSGSTLAGRAVVFAAPNRIEWIVMFLALLRARAVLVPLDATEPPGAQRRIAERLRAAYWWNGDALLALDRSRRFRDPASCLIKLTSGTTGEPRPLVFTAGQMLADARQVTGTMGFDAHDLNYALIPFGHSYGLGNLTFPLIAHGVPIVCGSASLPHAIAADFERWRPTVLPTVPAVFRALVASDLPAASFASLRLAISAGAALPPEVARAFAARFGRPIHNFYGSSETGGIAYDRTGRATLAGGVGKAMRGVRLTPQRGDALEICSGAVFTYRNPRRRGPLGCWRPADCVRVDEYGGLTLLGRRGATVKLAGRRVNLAEVLGALRRVAGVRDAWVGIQEGVEPVLGAAVMTTRSPADLRSELLAQVAPWKVPKKWAIVAEFPLTARGKADTSALHRAVFG